MRKRIGKITGILKKRRIVTVAGAVVVAIILVIVIVRRNDGTGPYEFIIIERQNLIQEVNVTGRVKAAESVELAFERTGTVTQVLANVGDTVATGQTLVTLRKSDIVALLNQADAQVDVERANLAELIDNADAQQNLTNNYNDVINGIDNALAKAEDAVRSKTTGIFSGSVSSGYNLTFATCSASIGTNAKTLRLTAELELNTWNREFSKLAVDSPRDLLDIAISETQVHLNMVGQFVDAVNRALLTKCATDNSTLDTARTNMATAQTNVIAAIESISNLQQAIASEKVSTANDDAVRAQEAKVRAAEASVQNYRSQISQTIISSPIGGVVTRQEAKVGETISANTLVVSVISSSDFEIEANIPEADIAKVKIGDISMVTLDAYGSDVVFETRVSKIDPGETIIEGVTTYKTTFQFTMDDDRIKSGMTANLDILTAELFGVIAIPQRTVISRQGQKLVRILTDDGEIKEVTVETGLRGSGGNIEITRGLQENDKVVTFIREE